MNKLKLIDGIVQEPVGGAHSNPGEMFDTVKAEIIKHLGVLSGLSPEERVKRRIDKFCSMGVYKEG
jgi:acetyl-CoA carboxylase carboxyl transferase subunit alpha